ncbi:hypothetical protein RQP46_011390 [Phenoliferia psychrophenolica]
MPEDTAHDASEVARIDLAARGLNSARRGKGLGVVVEHVQLEADGSVPPAKAGKGNRNSLLKKRSSPGLLLAQSTTLDKDMSKLSFSDKIAIRMGSKRSKSISSVGAILLRDEQPLPQPHDGHGAATVSTDSFVFTTMSSTDAEAWVESINTSFSFAATPLPSSPLPSPKVATSSSVPGALSSLANLRATSSLSSRRPKTAESASSSTFNGLPPDFNAGRRPSFLDRPPPSPCDYVPPMIITAASPPKKSESASTDASDVPAWIQAVRSAAATAAARADPPSPLRAKRSRTLLDPQRRRNSIALLESPKVPEPTAAPPPPPLDFGGGSGKRSRALMNPLVALLESSKDTESTSTAAAPPPPPPLDFGVRSGKFLGFLARGKKDATPVVVAAPPPMPFLFPPIPSPSATRTVSPSRRSASTTSLSSSLSETLSTSAASSEMPRTPETPKDLSSSSFSQRSMSSLSGKKITPVGAPHFMNLANPRRSTTSSTPTEFRRFGTSPSPSAPPTRRPSESRSSRPSTAESRPSTDGNTSRKAFSDIGHDSSVFGAAGDSSPIPSPLSPSLSFFSTATPPTPPPPSRGLEYIIKPSELILQMRGENVEWQQPSSTSSSLKPRRSIGALRALPSDGMPGGLSPSPRSASRQSTLAARSPTKSTVAKPPVPETPTGPRRRTTSFGVDEEVEGEIEGEAGATTPTPARISIVA